MLYCIWFAQVFILATNVLSMKSKENVKLDAFMEAEFTDVIKNISKVTYVLQDLMKRQEKLQEINKSQSFDDDTETDSEADEFSKDSSIIVKKKTEEKDNITTLPTFYVTRMLLSSEETEENEPSSDSESDINKIDEASNEQEMPKIEIHNRNISNQFDNEQSVSFSSSEASASDEEELEGKTRKPRPFKPKEINTRFVMVEHRTDESDSINMSQNNESKPVMKADIKPTYLNTNVKKVVHIETFPQGKTWNNIVNNKPIILKAQLDEATLRNRPKTAVVSGSKNQIRHEKAEREIALESEEENKAIDKEIFETKILRLAYGDACLKVVLRKCHKACKSANKQVCGGKSCKKNFKEKFDENARRGCIKEFKNTETVKNTGKHTDTRSSKNYDKFSDITRQGYMAACLPVIRTNQHENEKSLDVLKTLNVSNVENLNILRDRYEKACQKASSDKCYSACTYALKETCEVYECPKSRKKFLDKACKIQCKIAYGSNGKHKKSASDSDDSSNSSDSDDSLSLSSN